MRKTFFVVSFVFVFLCACYAGAQANLVETYELVDTWTGYEGIVNFGTIGAFAVDGDTLLASIKYKGSNRVYRFSPDGDVLHYFDTGTVLAQGIAVDASGNIYCSFENHRIRKYTSEGKYLWGIGTDGIRAGEFKNPNGILVHPNGYIYVVDTGNLRIQKFTADGKFVTQFGYDQFSGCEYYECKPHSIAVGTDGNLYVGTCDNGIYIFSADGSYLDKIYQNPSCNGSSYSIYSISLAIDANNNLFVPVEWYINSGYKSGILNLSSGGACNLIEGTEMSGGAESIKALAVRAISQTSQELFVAVQAEDYNSDYGYQDHEIKKYNNSGELVDTWKGLLDILPFREIRAVATDAQNNVYVLDCDGLFKFDNNGSLKSKWNTRYYDYQLAIDGQGNVYVLSLNQIIKYDSSGNILTYWGAEGNYPGEFSYPRDIAVDKEGYVYVADTDNLRIQKFTADGKFVTQFGYDQFSGCKDYECEPRSIAAGTDGKLYVGTCNNVGTCDNGIYIFSADGVYLNKIEREWAGKGVSYYLNNYCNWWCYPWEDTFSTAIDIDNNLYVPGRWCDYDDEYSNANGIIKLKPNGEFITGIISYGEDVQDIAVDATGNLFIAGNWPSNIYKYEKRYAETQTISIPLLSGWNLMSVPFNPLDTSIQEALSGIAGKYSRVWAYERYDWWDEGWRGYDATAPELSDLREIRAGIGYWIYMNQDASLRVTGRVSDPRPISLRQGWNLVGFNSTTEMPVADALSSIEGYYVSVWGYEDGEYKVYTYDEPEISDLEVLRPGRGYWIFVIAPCEWTIDTGQQNSLKGTVLKQESSKTWKSALQKIIRELMRKHSAQQPPEPPGFKQ